MPDPSPDTLTIARQFIEALPHSHALGMRLEAIGEGVATISMPYDARLIGDPQTGVIHGGAVSALMDTACGAAVSITLYFLLIPRWGWTGAATGTLIGEGSLVVAAWIALFVCQRRDDRDAMLAHPDLIDAAP